MLEVLLRKDRLGIAERAHGENLSLEIGRAFQLRPYDERKERARIEAGDDLETEPLNCPVQHRRNIEREIEIAGRQCRGRDVAAHLDELRIEPFVAEKSL